MKTDSVLSQQIERCKRSGQAPMTFPLWGAFVVQLSSEATVTHGHWSGRVEHVRSGHVGHFQSVDDLLAFIARVLTDQRLQQQLEGEGHPSPERRGSNTP